MFNFNLFVYNTRLEKQIDQYYTQMISVLRYTNVKLEINAHKINQLSWMLDTLFYRILSLQRKPIHFYSR